MHADGMDNSVLGSSASDYCPLQPIDSVMGRGLVAAGASVFYFTGGTTPAIVGAGVAAGCLSPFAIGVFIGIVI